MRIFSPALAVADFLPQCFIAPSLGMCRASASHLLAKLL